MLHTREGCQKEFSHANKETIEYKITAALCYPDISLATVHTFAVISL